MPRRFRRHALDREQYLLAVLAHTDNDEQRDGSRLTVEPHAHHGAVASRYHVVAQLEDHGDPRRPHLRGEAGSATFSSA